MNNTLPEKTLGRTALFHLKSCSTIAGVTAIVMMFGFFLQLGFGLYGLNKITSSYGSNGIATFWFLVIMLTTLVTSFLLISYYRGFSQNIALALADSDPEYFGRGFYYIKKIFTLQLTLSIAVPVLIILIN